MKNFRSHPRPIKSEIRIYMLKNLDVIYLAIKVSEALNCEFVGLKK